MTTTQAKTERTSMFATVLKAMFAHARRFAATAGLVSALALLPGCMSMNLEDLDGAAPEIPVKLVREMKSRNMTPESPVLVRIFKTESELELWKVNRSGRYALLKTYPICRWSGKLGPKTAIGDRHAPEGFYHVSARMLNPKSQFYLSFNLGYPNRLESALGYTGEALMVHGACSSSGCYAMTDQGISEIYAVVNKALLGGQQSFQVQAFPFRMTPKNLAQNRNDPNYAFWSDLKLGYDSFEIARRQPKVSLCGRRYVFDQTFIGGEPIDPLAACPPAISGLNPQVAAREAADEQAVTQILSGGLPATTLAYSDGGMHRSFRTLLARSGPEKLAEQISKRKYPVSRPDAALADPYR